jgi:hypothetical protein
MGLVDPMSGALGSSENGIDPMRRALTRAPHRVASAEAHAGSSISRLKLGHGFRSVETAHVRCIRCATTVSRSHSASITLRS